MDTDADAGADVGANSDPAHKLLPGMWMSTAQSNGCRGVRLAMAGKLH